MILYFFFQSFHIFVIFSAQREGVAKEMGEKKRRGRETERNVRTPQPYVTVGRRISEQICSVIQNPVDAE